MPTYKNVSPDTIAIEAKSVAPGKLVTLDHAVANGGLLLVEEKVEPKKKLK